MSGIHRCRRVEASTLRGEGKINVLEESTTKSLVESPKRLEESASIDHVGGREVSAITGFQLMGKRANSVRRPGLNDAFEAVHVFASHHIQCAAQPAGLRHCVAVRE